MLNTCILDIEPEIDGLKVVEGSDIIEQSYGDYLRDESNVYGSDVKRIYFPSSIPNIVYAVREANSEGEVLTVSGGRTGICAGSVPYGGYVLSLEKMNKILKIYRDGSDRYLLTAQSGIRLGEISGVLRNKLFSGIEVDEKFSNQVRRYFYPPDPTETSATLGGTVATNASGSRTLYYGPTRNWVEALTVVLANGRVLRLKRGDIHEKDGVFRVPKSGGGFFEIPAPSYHIPEVKHSAGYYSKKGMDLIDLFIGSEGTLGIISEVTVRIIEEPDFLYGGLLFFKDEETCVDFVEKTREKFSPLALEYFDTASLKLLSKVKKEQGPTSEIPEFPLERYAIYVELFENNIDGLFYLLNKFKEYVTRFNVKPEEVISALTKRDHERLKSFRHQVPERINSIIAARKKVIPELHKVGTDFAVPDDRLKEFLEFYRKVLNDSGLEYYVFGHIGNNHVHVNMIPENKEELDRAKKMYRRFCEKAVQLGGSVSAEHGIGKLKRDYLGILFDKNAISQMKKIKTALDPALMLNPGTLL